MENILKSVKDMFRDLIIVRKMSIYLANGDSFHLAEEFGNVEKLDALNTDIKDFN